MKRCEKCHVAVPSTRERCPLCQGFLFDSPEGEASSQNWDAEIFPYIPTVYREFSLLFRIMIFVSILVGLVACVLNFLIFSEGWWSFFVLIGIAVAWVTVAMAVRKRSSFCKRILYQVVTVSVLLVFIDWLSGWHGWAINFVIPGLCVFEMTAVAITALVMRRRIENYIIYLVVTIVFGFLPLLFLLTGWADVTWPSVLSVALSFLAFSGLILFAGKDTRVELKKRLHL